MRAAAVTIKVLPAGSWPVRLFDTINWAILCRASDTIVLDRFMAQRVARKAAVAHKITVLPLWPLEAAVHDIADADNAFWQQHVPAGKRVLMFAGNHTAANPLATLLDSAQRLQSDHTCWLMCVGGGTGKADVDLRVAAGVANIVSLPNQPLANLRFSWSAADMHVVAMGDDMVGIVHPCRVYGAMAVSRPLLLLSVDYEALSVQRNAPRWMKMLIKHGCMPTAP